ncbi:MAG: type II secretion system major pseudopilin GspG [Elusimicrobiota bacterium]
MKRCNGFTLFEVLLVLGLIGLLFSITLPRLSSRNSQAKNKICQIQISNIEMAIDSFSFDTGRIPNNQEGLTALQSNISNGEEWKGPYIKKKQLLDPWGRAFIYKTSPQHSSEFQLISPGADGKFSTSDDIQSEE